MNLIPLHCWSGYSLMRGPVSVDRLVEAGAAMKLPALALTDVNGLYGSTVFWQRAQAAGIRPIVGAELRDAVGGRVLAWPMDERGYENLCRLITALHADDYAAAGSAPTCRLARDLPARSDGLHIATDQPALAETLLAGGVAGARLWLEFDPPTQTRSKQLALAAEGDRLGLGLLATGRAMLLNDRDAHAARLLAAIRLGTTVARVADDDLPHPAAMLRPCDARADALVLGRDAWARAVARNARVAEQCGFRLLPRRPVFPKYDLPEGTTAQAELTRLCREGLARRYGRADRRTARRLARELDLIGRMGFAEYFLVVREIVQYARSRNAPVAGRGSGAGSLAAYVLGITNVCPMRFDLPFERFLHEKREDFPDLDIDFCWRIRDDVIDFAFRRWGADRVAMVCTHNTFQHRAAVREAGKALGYSDDQISRISKRREPRDALQRIEAAAGSITGLPHLLSVHPGGIVAGRKPIDRYVPIQPAAKGVTVTQLDKDGVEDIGLVKLDLLGNRALSTIRGAIERIGSGDVDIETLPADDPATMALLRRGDTVGVNQLESPAMRHLLVNMQPRDDRDVMKILALIRPGAAGVGMKETFVRRHRGAAEPWQTDPRVDAILGQTCGVMLYEDDVMLTAAALLGCPLSEADRFRKAVQKCTDDRQRLRLSVDFIGRCVANGVGMDFAKDTWVQMAKFNAYSFCRAHAASYARLAYAAAYFKTHWPAAFWVSALNNNQSMYHPRVYIEQARRDGVGVLPVEINRSDGEYTLESGGVRIGLARVDGVGPAAVERICAAREDQPFASLSDCCARARLGRDEARGLILAGAFDRLGTNRPTLLMELELLLAGKASRRGPSLLDVRPTVGEDLGDYSEHRKFWTERRILELSVRGHPLARWRPILKGRGDADSRCLRSRVGQRVRLAGLLEAYRAAKAVNGRTVKFLTLDDEWGLTEVTAFADRVAVVGSPVAETTPVIVIGRVEDRFDAVTISAERLEWLGAAAPPEPTPRPLEVRPV